MTRDNVSRPDHSTGHTTSVRRVIVGDFLSVTWRMTVPTVIGLALGYWGDSVFQTSPLGFMTGALIGFGFGVYLAIRVINRVKESR